MTIREVGKKSGTGIEKSPEQKSRDKLKVDRTKLSVTDDPKAKQKLREKIDIENQELRLKQSKRIVKDKNKTASASKPGIDQFEGWVNRVYRRVEGFVSDWAHPYLEDGGYPSNKKKFNEMIEAVRTGVIDAINDMHLTNDSDLKFKIVDAVMDDLKMKEKK